MKLYVSFNTQIDNNVTTIAVDYDSTVVPPTDPSRLGYRFLGWNTRSDGTGETWTETMRIREGVIFFAQWEAIYHRVTFLDWDGTVLSEAQVLDGGCCGRPASPEHEGYAFVGWDQPDDPVYDDQIIKAQFSKYIMTSSVYRIDRSISTFQLIFIEAGTTINEFIGNMDDMMGEYIFEDTGNRITSIEDWNTVLYEGVSIRHEVGENGFDSLQLQIIGDAVSDGVINQDDYHCMLMQIFYPNSCYVHPDRIRCVQFCGNKDICLLDLLLLKKYMLGQIDLH